MMLSGSLVRTGKLELSGRAVPHEIERDVLRSLPDHQPAHLTQIVAVADGEKVVAREWPTDGGERGHSVRHQDLSRALSGRIEQYLAWRWAMHRILRIEPDMQVFERHVRRLPAPPRLEQLGPEGQERDEGRAGHWRALLLECPSENQMTNRQSDLSRHARKIAPATATGASLRGPS